MREVVSRVGEFDASQIVASYVDLRDHLRTTETDIANFEVSFDNEVEDFL